MAIEMLSVLVGSLFRLRNKGEVDHDGVGPRRRAFDLNQRAGVQIKRGTGRGRGRTHLFNVNTENKF